MKLVLVLGGISL